MTGNIGDIFSAILPFVVLFAIFYFFLIRPQQVQQKRHREMIASLKKGDKVITNGGLIAEVQKVEERYFQMKLNDDTYVKLAKEYIAQKYDDTTPTTTKS
ncbi:preprotein translocase subunit YajC [Helicobacter monodelphidis]|uniref:preprotein translocase subunit YajC n=1 Tax=Helicobacter sp. 15-1451 TaxID=2004995 RepID=UPI000DCEDCFC|nr:preprotein translocase subunit YajC [Helicobacter sp. 15-1451]RAX57902.1 preprotein translocase subunit YajC [Helicobacter sp. 15-1451]